MMEERYHATTQNRFYPDMSNVKKILQWRQNLSVHLRILINLWVIYRRLRLYGFEIKLFFP